MANIAKITLAIFGAAFLASSPVIAAETATSAGIAQSPAATQAKPDLAGGLKQKAAEVVQHGQKKADDAAQKLQNALGVKKDAQDAAKKEAANAASSTKTGAKQEIVDVEQETVTVQTPSGTAQETTTVIVPETPVKK